MKLYVHIGAGKTGSSSIQKTLGNNVEKLDNQEVFYCGLMFERSPYQVYPWQKPNGWPIFEHMSILEKEKQLYDVCHNTISAIADLGCRVAIWSNETLFMNYETVLPVLCRLKEEGLGIIPILYIRRHDSWARSSYLQWGVKHKTYKGRIRNFKEWGDAKKFLYHRHLEKWYKSGFNSIIRNFDCTPDVVSDFLSITSISDLQHCRENETPSATALALWALYNNREKNEVLPAAAMKMIRASGVMHDDPPPIDVNTIFPNQDSLDKIMEETKEDRKKINTILASVGQPLFSEDQKRFAKPIVEQSQIDAALLRIIKNQNDVIERLVKRVERLEAHQKSAT